MLLPVQEWALQCYPAQRMDCSAIWSSGCCQDALLEFRPFPSLTSVLPLSLVSGCCLFCGYGEGDGEAVVKSLYHLFNRIFSLVPEDYRQLMVWGTDLFQDGKSLTVAFLEVEQLGKWGKRSENTGRRNAQNIQPFKCECVRSELQRHLPHRLR